MQSQFRMISFQEAFSVEWVSAWGPLLAVVVATAGVVMSVRMALKAIRRQTKNNLIAKRLDALIECNKRYAEVSEKEQRLPLSPAQLNDPHAAHVYRTFWSVQYEQWQFFEMGILTVRDLQIWAKVRTKQFAQNDSLCRLPLADTWEAVRGYYSHVRNFVTYVNELKRIGETNSEVFLSHGEHYPETISNEVGSVILKMKNNTHPFIANTEERAMNGGPHGQDV